MNSSFREYAHAQANSDHGTLLQLCGQFAYMPRELKKVKEIGVRAFEDALLLRNKILSVVQIWQLRH